MEDLAQQEGIQSLVCLPMGKGNEREGIISAYFPSAEGAPDEQVQHRLSREMNDGLAETLSALGWQIDRMKILLSGGRLEKLGNEARMSRRMVRETCMDVREVIDGLRPDVGHEGGLASALEEYVADFEIRTGIQTVLKLEPNPPPFSEEAELQLLRIVQEALINVRKHASAG
jgi:signal transduction histidine kinase